MEDHILITTTGACILTLGGLEVREPRIDTILAAPGGLCDSAGDNPKSSVVPDQI